MDSSFNLHKYLYNSFTVYNYNGKYKVVLNNVKRVSGYESTPFDQDETQITQEVSTEDTQEVSTEDTQEVSTEVIQRLPESLTRTKNKIFGYAYCNDWDYFATFTIDQNKKDRFDLNSFYKDFSKFINNFNRKLDHNIKYLLVPEQHKDGAWHMHGLISNLPSEFIHEFTLYEKLPNYLRSKIKYGDFVGSWIDYANKFGFNDLELIKDHERVSSYIIKYITKDMLNTTIYNCKHLYYCSSGLNLPKKISVVPIPDKTINYGFENDFCKIKWYDDLESLANDFIIC